MWEIFLLCLLSPNPNPNPTALSLKQFSRCWWWALSLCNYVNLMLLGLHVWVCICLCVDECVCVCVGVYPFDELSSCHLFTSLSLSRTPHFCRPYTAENVYVSYMTALQPHKSTRLTAWTPSPVGTGFSNCPYIYLKNKQTFKWKILKNLFCHGSKWRVKGSVNFSAKYFMFQQPDVFSRVLTN